MMDKPLLSKRLIRCSALVGRQRALVAKIRERDDQPTIEYAERVLRNFEGCLMALLATHRRRRVATESQQRTWRARRRVRNV